ncbi:MAG TPA: DUF4136 domain-containing protein [Bryobacteraceae bacterium]|nr:DUF4136 domain-containing protein [Bryobacteraceae bacterium]
MSFRLTVATIICLGAVCGQKVKTKVYTDPKECFKTYRLDTGSVLTSSGLVEDPTVNSIMKEAVGNEMNQLKIASAGKEADLEIHFMGGTSAGLQVDDLTVGNVAMWNIGGPLAVSSRSYKKSALVIAVVDAKTKHTVWAAQCTDNFGDPNKLKERIQNAVTKAFAKFPKNLACS